MARQIEKEELQIRSFAEGPKGPFFMPEEGVQVEKLDEPHAPRV